MTGRLEWFDHGPWSFCVLGNVIVGSVHHRPAVLFGAAPVRPWHARCVLPGVCMSAESFPSSAEAREQVEVAVATRCEAAEVTPS